MPKIIVWFVSDAEYRNALSEGILRMQESGRLAALKIKWWKEKKGGGACSVTFYALKSKFQICRNFFL